MTFQIGFVLAVVVIMIVFLVLEVARPEIIVFTSLSVLLLSGILTPDEALRGFSNQGMLTIALLFVVAGAVQNSGILNKAISLLLGHSNNLKTVLFRFMFPVTAISAFMNNTPIVVMLMSDIKKWSRDHHISPSKLLLPLSYAAIFGGMITLIGTATNLVVHGLMLDYGMRGMSMFQLSAVGIPAAILGILYMVFIGQKLLPDNKSLDETYYEKRREYLTEMVVSPDCTVIGKSIEQAGLRNLKGLFLFEIIRSKEHITPVPSYEKIEAGDRLLFSGDIATIVELQNIKGLYLETGTDLNMNHMKDGSAQLIEAVVSHHSGLLQKTIKQHNFRSRYDAAVVAVHRNHERIQGKIGDIVLRPGDTLLLLAGKEFFKRNAESSDFYLTSPVDSSIKPANSEKVKLILFIVLAMILVASLNWLSMFKASLLAVILLFITRSIVSEDVRKSVHLDVLLLIASSLGIGLALEKTGAAAWIALVIQKFGGGFDFISLPLLVYIMTNLLTEIITNTAAAVIMFPISVALANQMNIDPMGLIITMTIAASASFVTPIGYQTNLIVYGPGGYKFFDYVKVGLPLSLIYMVTTVSIVGILW
ncbi:SLC13 family permease [Ferviditalea candida]|uniref:SLC13 family permease n=1 Tax=Ferviditalea candida TaxID=3108399 RepID=A0ABU5ZPD3_9BACL|nr:SLC13 family permease [Paenibacillaceae bacterium T2]